MLSSDLSSMLPPRPVFEGFVDDQLGDTGRKQKTELQGWCLGLNPSFCMCQLYSLERFNELSVPQFSYL